MRAISTPTVMLKLLFLVPILATATSCVELRRGQVSYLGPQIEGVRHIQLAESDGSGRIQLFADILDLGTGMVWAPDGEQVIVFAGPDRVARLANVETGTLGPCVDCGIPSPGDLAFSPSGAQVAVGSSDGLYIVDLGNLAHQVVSDIRRPGWIQWLGEGDRIGFWGGPDSIMVVDLGNGQETSLTAQYKGNELTFFAPQWSPDGQKLAVRTSGVGGFAIQVMSTDGSNLTRIADYLYRGEFLDFGALPPPQWSPDGSKLLFSGFTPAGDTDIFVVNVDGSGLQNITNSPGKDDVPSWSPDGRQIVFVTSRDGNDEIYVMNADGSDPTNISNSPLLDEFSPAWRPQADFQTRGARTSSHLGQAYGWDSPEERLQSVAGYEDHYDEFLRNTQDRPPRDLLLKALEAFEQQEPKLARGYAIDLGFGAGVDTLELLRRGWRVMAVDQQPAAFELLRSRVPKGHERQLETALTPFGEFAFPEEVDLVNASYSLPFCPPADFDAFWQALSNAIRPGGRFAGHFFGDRDEWVGDPTITFHTVEQARAALAAYEIEYWLEEDEDGTVSSGAPKHWHLYHIVAKKR